MRSENHVTKTNKTSSEHKFSKIKGAATGAMAFVLAASSAAPAFASDTISFSSATFEPKLPKTGVEEFKLPGEIVNETVPTRPPVVNQTVPLSPNGSSMSDSSIAALKPANGDGMGAGDQGDSEERAAVDTETCVWTRDGNTWSTTRGGKTMSVSNALAFGIDVSQWQAEIDWARVKNAGVQFAILRCAYGSQTSGHEDKYFAQNVKGCIENGIPFGVYLYSNNSSVEGGEAEAYYALDIMARAGATPERVMFPVYYDIEDEVHKNMTSQGRGDMAEAFCSIIERAGYKPGVYASRSWLDGMLDDPRFDNWTRWAANYPYEGEENATSSYKGPHDLWQCMSRGIIDGINTRVDIDFDYRFSEGAYNKIYDYVYYRTVNPDVAQMFGDDRLATFNHFMTVGMAEGRQTSPYFNLHGYFNANVDLRRQYGLDLKQYYLHYQQTGQYEGRSMNDSMVPQNIVRQIHAMDLSAIYDPFVYLTRNPDLEEVYTMNAYGYKYIDDVSLFNHFLNTGIAEGRLAK